MEQAFHAKSRDNGYDRLGATHRADGSVRIFIETGGNNDYQHGLFIYLNSDDRERLAEWLTREENH